MDIDQLWPFLPPITPDQKEKLSALPSLYTEWNAKVNVISRKDMEHFVERHLLHSLSLVYYCKPKAGGRVIDIGTGGGFPGIPLAILFPDTPFLLVDSIGKKISVVQDVARELGLTNVKAVHGRAEVQKGHFDFAVTRAVARLSALVQWCTRPGLKVGGLYCLKGGDLREEVEEIDRYPSTVYKLDTKLPQPFFETKKVVFVQLTRGKK